MDIFSEDRFTNEDAARAYLEASLWPEGPTCPHCGSAKAPYANAAKRGVYRCSEKECRKDFTVTTGTVMERSHIALHKWVQAFHLMCSSKKGISAHQLHRTLKITYKAAWFMAHRIRESMRDGGVSGPLGGNGRIVEADETYYGKPATPPKPNPKRKGLPYTKGPTSIHKNTRPIVALVERGGNVRTFHVAAADKVTVTKIVRENVARESRLHTDESRLYTGSDTHFEVHKTVRHTAKEYARRDTVADPDFMQWCETVHTNSAEGYFSIFKRGMKGIYQHCGEKHLHRYLAEYDFRYNHRVKLGFNDTDRATIAVKQASGKRLTYRQAH
jgi:transposase-like protein